MNHYTAKQVAELLQKDDPQMNLRTVRYYTQIGVIPPLELAGNKRVYTDHHVACFRAILALSKSGETLASIQRKLQGLSMEEVRRIGETLPLLQAEQILSHETYVISEDVVLSISARTAPKLKSDIIRAVTRLVQGE
ncbi:MerR family transcriptional regulator [Paenibacillus arenilitoris]|uniref:MerR family transcriptional regulator n=1 Tax=Paenibacillus arenilitoris TaxID=2772299 RepID=A0A927H3S9_9BACL|nr:MerR family transcriptional regulator [Paenibacillus arenilitoris]MBD2867185.1 MerR family transcriptional regulator [Paenibacillus arenilitoris]